VSTTVAAASAVDGEVVPAETVTRFRKGVKQVATLGPKTFNKEMIEKLFLAGVDVFRLNLSHGAEDKVSRLILTLCLCFEESYLARLSIDFHFLRSFRPC